MEIFDAGLYAHSAERDWESNRDVLESQCDDGAVDDIAEQLVRGEVGRKLKVVFGGGRGEFRDQTAADEEGLPGRRTDKADLIQEWLRAESGNRTFIWNKVRREAVIHSSIRNMNFLDIFPESTLVTLVSEDRRRSWAFWEIAYEIQLRNRRRQRHDPYLVRDDPQSHRYS